MALRRCQSKYIFACCLISREPFVVATNDTTGQRNRMARNRTDLRRHCRAIVVECRHQRTDVVVDDDADGVCNRNRSRCKSRRDHSCCSLTFCSFCFVFVMFIHSSLSLSLKLSLSLSLLSSAERGRTRRRSAHRHCATQRPQTDQGSRLF